MASSFNPEAAPPSTSGPVQGLELSKASHSLLAAALKYADSGLLIFPCNDKKRPLVNGGFYAATTDKAQIRAWWDEWPTALIGMPTGDATKTCVLDIDVKSGVDGYASILDWETLSPVIVQTRSGGAHIYFSNDPDVRNSAGKVAPGVDVRATGGYVIIPPSPGYEFLNGSLIGAAKLPSWPERFRASGPVMQRADASTASGRPLVPNSSGMIPEGQRNSSLVSLAGTMRRRGMSASEILPGLQAVNAARCVPPLEDDEVSQIAKSIGRYPPSEDLQAIVEGERRRAQRGENVKIGSGSDVIPTTVIHTIESLLGRNVFIRDGSQVADVTCPQSLLKLADFRNATAGSKHKITKPDGETYTKPASQAWLEHAERLEADTLTFRAGAGLMTTCPNGQRALNFWRPRLTSDVPNNWLALASHFVDHVSWLWGVASDEFLDWLAHIEQYPGALPHYGWIHTSPVHGMGRNWISSVLARVFCGHVAASLDLVGMLEGQFNDRLSRCLLAIVDEINEGGSNKYRHADTLRQLVTAEFREINPKYGRRRVEYNATRWLIFSNQTGALPLDEHDRRFWVVSHNGPVKAEGYYTRLYGMLSDPDFIASVVEFLRRRDISSFNPGKRPPMTDAKAELVSFARTEDDEVCTDLVAHWPVDVITAAEMNARLPGHEGVSRSAARYAMNRAGIRKLRKVRTSTCSIDMAYALRRYEQWVGLEARELKSEIGRFSTSEKLTALSGDVDA